MIERTAEQELRGFERVALAEPGDGGARLRLARQLARLGRRRDALAALDLGGLGVAAFSGEGFSEARALADELWEQEILALAPVASLATDEVNLRFDGTGRFAVWRQDSGALEVWDAVATLSVAPSTPLVARSLAFSDSSLFVELDGGRLEERALREGCRTVAARDRSDPELRLRAVSPEGDRLTLARSDTPETPGLMRVVAWPSLEVVVDDLPATASPFWDARHIVHWQRCPDGSLEWVARSLDGGPAHLLPDCPWSWTYCELGPAILEGGLRIHDLRTQRVLTIADKGAFSSLSVSSDRRGVRFASGDRLGRVEIDRERGAVATPPDELARRLGGPARGTLPQVRWHPHADIAADVQGRRGLIAPDGRVVRSFASSGGGATKFQLMGWSRSGDSLYVRRNTPSGWLSEIWRSPEADTKRSA